MGYALRDFTCGGCGKVIKRNAPAGATPRCLECNISRSTTSAVQMHAKDGEVYERWLLASIEKMQTLLQEYRIRKAQEDPADVLRAIGRGSPPTP